MISSSPLQLGLNDSIARNMWESGRSIHQLVSDLALTTIIVVIVYLLLAYLVHIALKLLEKTELARLLGILRSIARVR